MAFKEKTMGYHKSMKNILVNIFIILPFLCINLTVALANEKDTGSHMSIGALTTLLQNDTSQGLAKVKKDLETSPVIQRREILTWLMQDSYQRKNTEFNVQITKIFIEEYLRKEPETLLLTYEWILELSYKIPKKKVSREFEPLLKQVNFINEDIILMGVYDVSGFKKVLDELYVIQLNKEKKVQKENKGAVKPALNTSEWTIFLLQARYGNQNAIKRILWHMEKDYDDIVSVTRKFKDLKLMGNDDVKNYLLTYLYSEKRLPQIKSNVKGSLYASYAAQVLSVLDEKFPIKKERFNEEDIVRIRQWYTQNKE